jgi:hypothetical protein
MILCHDISGEAIQLRRRTMMKESKVEGEEMQTNISILPILKRKLV